jgi:hypothetical protein
MPTLLLANPNSRAMVARPEDIPPEVRPFYDVIANRLLWTLHSADVAVVPGPVDEDFLAYLAGVLGLPAGEPAVFSLRDHNPSWYPGDNPALVGLLRDRIAASGVPAHRWRLACYFHDRDAAHWQRVLGIGGRDADIYAQNMVELVNSKSVFRALAAAAGTPVAEGRVVDAGGELVDAVAELLDRTGSVIVKQDQNSGGDGNTLVSTDPLVEGIGAYGVLRVGPGATAGDLRAALPGSLTRQPELAPGMRPARFVVEVYHPGSRTLSAELYIPRSGAPVLLNYGDMRMEPVWRGYVFPPQDLAPTLHARLCADSQQIAVLAQRLGYHGLINIDAIVDPAGRMLFNEFNGRAGGATNIDTIARRLLGPDYLDRHVVASRNSVRAPGIAELSWHLADQGLAYDPARRSGVVVATDNTPATGTVEYVVLGADREETGHMESLMERLCEKLTHGSEE